MTRVPSANLGWNWRYALGGTPYTIHFFFGGTPEPEVITTTSLLQHPNHVGMVYTFSSRIAAVEGGPARCANCEEQRDDDVLSQASIPLTIPLYNAAVDETIDSIWRLAPEAVEPYLTNQLTWVALAVR